jgi:hypothetical protein
MRTTTHERIEAFDVARARLEEYASVTSDEAARRYIQAKTLRVALGGALGIGPEFAQVRAALLDRCTAAHQRVDGAEAVLTRLERAPRPVPGTRELYEVEKTARQAERDRDDAQEELVAWSRTWREPSTSRPSTRGSRACAK